MFKWIDNLSNIITKMILERKYQGAIQEINDWSEIRKSLKSIRNEVRTTIPLIEEDEKRKARNKEHGSIL